MAKYWPNHIGLWSKPRNEWPISVQRELKAAITPAWIVAECENDD